MGENLSRRRGNVTPQAKARYEVGLSHLHAGRHELAAETLRSVVRLAPEWAEGHLTLGIAYAEMNQPAEMNDALRRAAALRPGAGALHLCLGVVQGKMGRYDIAAEHLAAATSLRSHDAAAHFLLARVCLAAGQRDSALGAIRQTLRLVPDHLGASLLLTECVLGGPPPATTVTTHQVSPRR